MLLTGTAKSVPFTPPWRETFAASAGERFEKTATLLRAAFETTKDQAALDAGLAEAERVRKVDENPPVFFLRAGDVIERAQMEAELSGPYRAGRVHGYELRAAIRNGVETLLAEDPEVGYLLGLIDAEEQGDTVTLSDDDKLLLSRTRDILAEHWPEYRDLLAQLERRREIAPIVALRWFCTGWENCTDESGKKPAKFERGRDGRVAMASLTALAPLEMSVAGNRAYSLQYVDDTTSDFSPRPDSSGSGPATSNSDGTSKAAGKSKAKPGRKTQG